MQTVLQTATTVLPTLVPPRHTSRWFRRLPMLALLGLLGGTAAQAQVVRTLPGDYASLAAAITDLNTNGVPAGGVTVNIAAGYTETAANLLLTATGTSTSPIVFQKAGTGTNPTITAAAGTNANTSTSTLDAIIKLRGSDYVTFEGLTLEDPATNTGDARMEFGVVLYRASNTNGCQNVTVRDCAITLQRGNTGTGAATAIGIFSAASTDQATAVLSATGATAAGQNSNNKFYGNTIRNVNTGIYLLGLADATPYANFDQGNDIGGNIVATGNSISAYGGTASTTAYGVRANYQNNLNTSYNTISNAINGGVAGASTLYGIFYQSGSTNASLTVSNNTIALSQAGNGSQVAGIATAVSGTGSTSISNNAFTYVAATGNSGDAYAILQSGSQTGGLTLSGNTYNNTGNTVASSGSQYFISNSNDAANSTTQNNTFSNLTKTVSGGTVYGYYNNGSPGSGTQTYTGNTITNITLTGSTPFYGLYQNSSASQNQTVSNNTVSNVTGGSSAVYGMALNYGSSGSTLTGNTVAGLSGAGTIYGITVGGGSLAGLSATQNTVSALSTTGSTIYGLYVSGGSGTQSWSRNKVFNLASSASGASVHGFYISSGPTTTNFVNNLLGDLRAPAGTGLAAVSGVYIGGGTTVNLYYNTIYLNATSTGATFGTSGVYLNSTSAVLDARNNIVVNKSVAAGTNGYTAALRRAGGTAGTAPANLAATSNANIYYAGSPSATNVIYTEGTSTATNTARTLSDYKSLVTGREINSQTEDTPFSSTVGTSASFLHIDPAAATLAEGKAVPIGSVTIDFDGDSRNASTPDIGADEGSFITAGAAVDLAAAGLISPSTTGCYGAAESVVAGIQNNGTAPIDFAVNPATVTVSVTGAATQTLTATVATGTLAVGATQNVTVGTLNMTATGTYSFALTATAQGDGNTTNDTGTATRIKVALATLPQQLNFTGYTGANLTTLYPGWYEATGAATPTGTTSAWTNDDYANVTGGPNTISAKINLFSNSKNEWIVGPRVLAQASSVLTYDLALTSFAATTASTLGSDDRLEVRVSTDCGLTFTTVKSYTAATAISNTGQSETVALGSYAGQEIIVAFFATEGATDDTPDNDVFIDNISLSTPPPLDLTPTALASPATGLGCYSPTETVIVTVRNLGTQALDFSVNPATVMVNVTGAATQTLTATLSTGMLVPGATQNISVAPVLDMSAPGTYTFAIAATVQGDQNTANDALTPAPTRTATAPVAGTATSSSTSFCQTGSATLTLTGSANGTIQWQQSTDNATFTDISGATAATYSTGTLTATTYYRARTTCNTTVATSNVLTITNTAPTQAVEAPTAACSDSPFTIAVTTNSTGGNSSGTAAPNVAIPDNSLTGVSSTITLSGAPAAATVSSSTAIRVTVNLTHTFDGDVDLYLVGPNNAGTLELSTDNGSTGDNYTNTVFSTTATNIIGSTGNNTAPFTGTFAPEGNTATAPSLASGTGSPAGTYTLPATALNGATLNGDWKLYVFDDANNDTGTLINWSLSISDASIPASIVTGPGTISAPAVSGTTSTYTITGAPAGPAAYSIVTTEPGGCTVTTTQTVTVTPAPTATLPATAASCGTSAYSLTGAIGGSAITGTYTSTGTGTFSPNATTLNATYTPSAADVTAGSVTITLTAAGPAGTACAAATAQTVLTINPATTAAFSYAAASYCQGATPNPAPTVTGTAGGSFSSTTGLTLDATTGALNLATSTPGTYTVTYSVNGPCPSSATATVTITAPAIATFSYASSTLCVTGTAATPTVTGTTGGAFSSTTGLTINATTGAITPATSTPGTYTVTYSVGGNCPASATATVTITTAPVATFSYGSASYCVSGTTPVTPVFAAGASAGTFSSTTGLSLNAATGTITPATSTPGTYTVTNNIAAAGGCAATTSTFTVTITAAPVAAFTYSNAAYCAGATGSATPVLGTGATAGTFTASGTGLVVSAAGVINLSTSTPGTYTVTNTIAAANGCAATTATFAVIINARPAQPTFTPTYNGATTTLTSSSTTGNQWYLGGVAITGATNSTYVVSSAAQFGSYTVVVTNTTTGCSSLPSLPLIVNSSVKPLAGSALSVYPNPTTDGNVTVELKGYTKATELSVYNAVGQLVLSTSVSGKSGVQTAPLDMRQLPAGVYILRARTEGGLDVRRITKE